MPGLNCPLMLISNPMIPAWQALKVNLFLNYGLEPLRD